MMREVWKCGDEGHVSRHGFVEVIIASAERAPVPLCEYREIAGVWRSTVVPRFGYSARPRGGSDGLFSKSNRITKWSYTELYKVFSKTLNHT